MFPGSLNPCRVGFGFFLGFWSAVRSSHKQTTMVKRAPLWPPGGAVVEVDDHAVGDEEIPRVCP
jgi:hypothetical protein